MTAGERQSVRLSYGTASEFTCEAAAGHIVAYRPAPDPLTGLHDEVRAALENPLDFPSLARAIIPEDRIAVALDRHTPCASTVIAAIWQVFASCGVAAENVTIIQPVAVDSRKLPDPRSELPPDVREAIAWKVHDSTAKDESRYLASTMAGERIYLSRDVVEADFVLPVGQIAFDPVIGFRGTNSVFYPGLSTAEVIARAHGQGHSELNLEDERPLRQVMDEVSWLMGVQFSVQVIAAADGGVSHVLAGACDSVLARGKELLSDQWLVRLDARCELVVAAIDGKPESQGWPEIGAALAAARNLVTPGGTIVILSELDSAPEDGINMLRGAESPLDAIQPLRQHAPPDLLAATELATAADWAHIYLVSRLENELVDDLFITPVTDVGDVQRLVETADSCVFLGAAQNVCGVVGNS